MFDSHNLVSVQSRPSVTLGLSLCMQAVLIGLAVLLPILRPEPLPQRRDYIRALIYDPPPPPPAPLPIGRALLPDVTPARPAAPTVKPTEPVLPFPKTEAALASVRQWVFSPALKHGRPVPTLALAPVRFEIL